MSSHSESYIGDKLEHLYSFKMRGREMNFEVHSRTLKLTTEQSI